MVKRWLTPQDYDRPGSHLEFFLKIHHVHGQRWLTPQVRQTRLSPRFFFKDSSCPWSKDDWLPNYDRPGSHLEFFFLKIQHVHCQKMIDPPGLWQTRISPRIFLKIQHVHGQKMIDPPGLWQTRLSPRIFLKIHHVHGQRWLTPPGKTDQAFT